MNIASLFSMVPDTRFLTSKVMLCGIECEIESVDGQQTFPSFHTSTDGSLRNNGYEFISKPLTRVETVEAFSFLHDNLDLEDPSVAFNSRTSTHVHINVLAFTPQQVKTLILLYALYEEFFFLMVEPSRRSNIHCVPLTETYLPSLYKNSPEKLINHWHKYTALNILPVSTQGSVEFRHLQGTNDKTLLSNWLLAIENLWTLSTMVEVTPTFLLQEDLLRSVWINIFGHSRVVMNTSTCFNSIIENALLDVKLAFV